MTQTNPIPSHKGFALLITIVIISIVLAVGISLLEITVKQISLSTTGRDSEVAFHGAQAAVECAQSVLLDVDVLAGPVGPLTVECFNDSDLSTPVLSNGNRTTYINFQFDWNNGAQDLCSESDMYIMDATDISHPTGGTYQETFMGQGLGTVTCADGDVCTFVFSRGFNRGCGDLGSLRTVQRELTISF